MIVYSLGSWGWVLPLQATSLSTSFPGSLFFPSSLAQGDGKKRDPGNEVAALSETNAP